MPLRAKTFPVPYLILVSFYLPMKMEQTECSETSAYKIQTPGNYPKGSIQHTEHGENLKLRTKGVLFLHDNAPAHRVLATQKRLAYLSFQCLDHPPCSPDMAPLDYYLFPGLKNNWKVAIFLQTWMLLLPRRPGWTDYFLIYFWVACKS